MDRIESKFEELKRADCKAFIPFITAGDPDLASTVELVVELERSGADIIELGVPFSDPMADGPVIQRASERALRRGVSSRDCLETVRIIRTRSDVPLVLFSYLNPLLAIGLDRLGRQVRQAGVDAVLVTDLVPEEAGDYIAAMRGEGVDTVFLIAPTSTDKRLEMVAEASTGFIYAVARAGVTGVRESLSDASARLVERVRRFTSLPVAVGFGISSPEHVAEVWRNADAAVVGSRIVAEIEARAGDPGLVARIGELCRHLVSSRDSGK